MYAVRAQKRPYCLPTGSGSELSGKEERIFGAADGGRVSHGRVIAHGGRQFRGEKLRRVFSLFQSWRCF